MSSKRNNSRAAMDAQRQGFWLAVLLFGLVLGVFYPLTRADFLNYDDDVYVTANYHVQGGLGAKQIAWAFTNTDAANWHPLTWLSHMLDCQWYGLKPGGHHFTSVVLHALNAALLFGVMRAMTGAMWRSLAVALLFGLHPLRVESVAWISERKDVLSGTFWLLAMRLYAGYAGELKSKDFKRPLYYWLAVLFFICGLMSKPMVVTLPFVLLVMDWWPLKRICDLRLTIYEPKEGERRDRELKPSVGTVSLAHAIAEKIPFFLVSMAGCVVTFAAQKRGGAVTEIFPLGYRLETAIQAYARYVGKFFYPANLAVLYPHPAGGWGWGGVAAAAILLAGISAAVLAGRRSHPYGLAGWLWFLGTLVPVIGLVQVGSQAMADRYMYLPGIGLNLMVVWGAWELAERLRLGKTVVAAAAAAVGIICIAVTEHQMIFWKDSGTLFGHAVAVTRNNYQARKALGDFYWAQGNGNEAVRLYREALKMYPRFEGAHLNLGAVLMGMGRTKEAEAEFRQAIALKPDDASAYNDLGAVTAAANMDEAIKLFRKAVEVNPRDADAWKNLGHALDQKGQFEEAMADFRRDLELRPDVEAHYFLGMDLGRLGRKEEAVGEFNEALRLQTNYNDARRALEALGYKAVP